MTKAKYGIRYGKWTNKELRQFAQQRNIDLPHNDRRALIRSLREEDSKASINFLELPPEIRNLIYYELLTPKSDRKDPESFVCQPHILLSCKQVYGEAADILHTTSRIPISLQVHPYSRRNGPWTADSKAYGVQVCFNGIELVTSDSGGSALQIQWPQCLAKIHLIDLQVRLYPPWPETDHAKRNAAWYQMNRALGLTCASLAKSPRLQHLQVSLESELRDNATVPAIVWPLFILAAVLKSLTCSAYVRNRALAKPINDIVTAVRKILALKHTGSIPDKLNGYLAQFSMHPRDRLPLKVVTDGILQLLCNDGRD